MIAAVTQEGKTAFNCREGIIILEHNEIVICSVNKKHITIHTKTGDIYTFFGTLKEIEDILKGKNFVRCHKSYLINADYIKRIANNLGAWEVEFNYIEEKAPLSRQGRKKLIQIIKQRLIIAQHQIPMAMPSALGSEPPNITPSPLTSII